MTTRPISAREALPLRCEILRPGRPLEAARYAGDESPTTLHWGAFTDAGELVAVATAMPEPKVGRDRPAWRLRGMASAAKVRGMGYGSAVLRALADDVASRAEGTVLWCNARVAAIPFYRAHGFAVEGDQFEIEGIGPHFVMWKVVG